MTGKQTIIILKWTALLLFWPLFYLVDDWILRHWDVIRWPFLAAIVLLVLFGKAKKPQQGGLREIEALASRHPWLRIHFLVFGLSVAGGAIFAITRGIRLDEMVGPFEMFLAFFLMLGPAMAVKDFELFRNNGGMRPPE